MPNPLTPEAVRHAMAEYDEIGPEAFLTKYGAGQALEYYLVEDGREYPSKAIVRAGYAKLPKGVETPARLTGGYTGAAKFLADLGFTVEHRPRSDVPWSWDEHVLALELYMRNPASPPAKTSADVIELSRLLGELAEINGIARTPKFRNANGVYMKMMNFRRLDPAFRVQGKSGLNRGAQGEEEVWQRYAQDKNALLTAANAIRTHIGSYGLPLSQIDDDVDGDIENEVDYDGAEGSLIVRIHLARERNAALVRAKKADVLRKTGRLACECCAFDFSAVYGTLGAEFVEVHHIKPLSRSEPGRRTPLSELATVCSNCHRMLHRRGLITIEQLRHILAGHR